MMYVEISGRQVPINLKSGRSLKNNFGQFNGSTECIDLWKTMDVSIRRRTLAHECFHAFLHFTGYNELLADISDNMEEAMCRAFEQSLGELFLFSPELEAWIKGV